MQKSGYIFMLLTLLAIGVVSCTRPTLPDFPDEITDRARDLVSKLSEEDYAGVTRYFDATMRQQLPEKRLAEIWQQLLIQAGTFVDTLDTRSTIVQGYDVIFVTTEFENLVLDIRVVFDKEKLVAGLFFQPAQEYYEGQHRLPPYADTAAYTEREVTVGSSEWALPGTISVPVQGGPHPAVVLVHGSGPQDRDETIGPNKPFKDLASGLATKGIAVLRYEKRTLEHGSKMASLMGVLTPEEEVVEDALAAVSLLKETEGIDPDRIYVLGHSLGGTMAPRIALEDPDIAGLIILAGSARPLEDLILEQYQYLADLDGEVTGEEKTELEKMELKVARVKDPDLSHDTRADQLPLGIPAPFWLYLRDYNPAGEAKDLPIPMLILQGERDYQVTMTDFDLWQQTLGFRQDIRFKSYPGLNHLFIKGEGPGNPDEYWEPGNVAKEVIDDIANWLQRR